ncbi:MAG: DUF5317 domain-containing protein [Actinomycetota bacterium]|nr:DUF5317 domain-containing protein [Actinomycetota bacterium]
MLERRVSEVGSAVIELVFISAGVALGAALLQDGSLERLASVRLRFTWLVFGGLATQIAVGLVSPRLIDLNGAFLLLMAANALVALFLIVNLRVPGMALAGAGLVMNLAVIAVNGAMPVLPQAAESVGRPITAERSGLRHEVLDDQTELRWLADAIPVKPLRTVLSLGDVLLALGLGLFVYRATRPPRGRRTRARGASGSAPAAEP